MLLGLLVVGLLIPLGITLGRIPIPETIFGLGEASPTDSQINSATHKVSSSVQTPNPQSSWRLNTFEGSQAELILSPDHQDLKRIEVTRAETNDGWHIQLSQSPLRISGEEWYSLRFRARADDVRKMGVAVSQDHDPWDNLGLYRSVGVMKQWQDFEWEFRALADDDLARIQFDLGGWNVPVEIAGVRLLKLSERVLKWRLNFREGSEAGLAEIPGHPLGIRVAITKAHSRKPHHIQLVQRGHPLHANVQYRLRFLARADAPRDLSLGVSQADYPWKDMGLNQTVTLTQDWQPFELEFIAKSTEDNARLYFNLGQQNIPVDINAVLLQRIVESVQPSSNLNNAPATMNARGAT